MIQNCKIENEKQSAEIEMPQKKSRNRFSFAEKANILKEAENELSSDICKQYGINERTLRKWKSNQEEIKSASKKSIRKNFKKQSNTEKLDDEVFSFLLDAQKKGVSVTSTIIKRKAKSLNKIIGGNDSFKATEGWLRRWKLRKGVRTFEVSECKNIVDQSSNETESEDECSPQIDSPTMRKSQNTFYSVDCNILTDESANQTVDPLEISDTSFLQNSAYHEKPKIHHLPLPACNFCRFHCTTKILGDVREKINDEFWNLDSWTERKKFFIAHVMLQKVKRRTTESQHKRNRTYVYYLPNKDNVATIVCRTFFLTTLGFKKNNDTALLSALNGIEHASLEPQIKKKDATRDETELLDRRDTCIREHIESYHPSISHYRRENAPNRRYLTAEITVKEMHLDFIDKFPVYSSCSYEVYRNLLKKMNISFAKSGNEECEQCEIFEAHHPDHNKDHLASDCDSCNNWTLHIKKATEANALYQKHVERASIDLDATIYSADLQKVIMFPIMDSCKIVLFARRAVLFNQSFVPVQSTKGQNRPFAAIWNESIAGRKAEDLVSAFCHFFLFCRDRKHVIIWLDNCSTQNKNWCLFTFFIYIINSNKTETTTIEIYYFEKGHTFMSTESFHHQVVESIKRQKNVYDFMDFEEAVRRSNSNVVLKSMHPSDFCNWKDLSCVTKLKTSPQVNLNEITTIRASRGDYHLEYKLTYDVDENFKKLDFLQAEIANLGILNPESRTSQRGICRAKKADIVAKLVPLMPISRRDYWLNIPENYVEDLVTNLE